jgi:hypothetical protein
MMESQATGDRVDSHPGKLEHVGKRFGAEEHLKFASNPFFSHRSRTSSGFQNRPSCSRLS